MDHPQEILDLSLIFTKPSTDSSPKILAQVAIQCDALGLRHSGGMFTDPLTQAERDDLRWYLEEYWQWPYLEFAARGKRVEELLGDIGRRFYQALFGNREAQHIIQAWRQQARVQHRISIVSEIASILRLPWELLADAQGFLVLCTDPLISLVRRLPEDEHITFTPPFRLPLRILLVTARPEDVGFVDSRSISRELVDELQGQLEGGTIELEFLRPPTFAALSERLKNTDRPIHVLHFDGHGGLGGKKQQGVLLFEDKIGKQSLVEASDLAKVLKNSGVRLAVLTACQSAMGTREDDAFSSVSTQLINNGVNAVIAMSSSILVISAALYAEAFYRALAGGLPVSLAQERARLALQKDPHRHLFRRRQDEEAEPVTLADWWVPHFYQQHPLLYQLASPTLVSVQSLRMPSIHSLSKEMPAEPRYGFSGRAHELLQIERYLLQRKLVVLYGFGGIGKTALAREAADWLTRTQMYDEVCFISFEQMRDVAWLLGELGRYLGIYDGNYNPNDQKMALARLKPVLDKRRMLVIADNLESILPPGEATLEQTEDNALWEILMALCEIGVGVLLTTRDLLIGGNKLATGPYIASLHLKGLQPDDAYTFASRLLIALRVDRNCVPYTNLRDLLTQLDHHPLAIQLVVPALRQHSLETIHRQFAELLPEFQDDELTGRNRSLLASLNYSLRRLSETERSLLSRLALFESGASEDDLLTIIQISKDNWADLCQALEEAGLLSAEPMAGFTAPFLHFHPVLAPFLRSQQGATDIALRNRYAQRYATLVQSLSDSDIHHPRATRTLVQKELFNLRRALELLLESGELEKASRMAYTITQFLAYFGLVRENDEMRQRVGAAIAAKKTKEVGALTNAEYWLERGLGDDEFKRGDVPAATARFKMLLARMEALPKDSQLGPGSYRYCQTLGQLARCLGSKDQTVLAERYLREALEGIEALIKQNSENKYYMQAKATALMDLADLLAKQGNYEQAQDVYEQALKIDKQIGHLRNQAVTLGQLGNLAWKQRKFVLAKSRYEGALQAFQELSEPVSEAGAWHQLGVVAEEQSNWAEAERCYRESLSINEYWGNAIDASKTCNNLASVAWETGHPIEAEGWYRRVLELDELAHSGSLDAGHLTNLAALLVNEVYAGRAATSRLTEAKQFAKQALTIMETREVSAQIWITLGLLARIAEKEGQTEEAQTYHRRERETYAAFEGNRYHINRQYGQNIADFAGAARGNTEAREAALAWLSQLETRTSEIIPVMQRIWSGERNWHKLVEDIDNSDALLILRVLETIAAQEKASVKPISEEVFVTLPEELIESLSAPVQIPIGKGDYNAIARKIMEDALASALAKLEPEIQQRISVTPQTLREPNLAISQGEESERSISEETNVEEAVERETVQKKPPFATEKQQHPQGKKFEPNPIILQRETGVQDAKAESLYQLPLHAHEQLGHKQPNPNLASRLHNLANLYAEQGKYVEAESFHRQALRIFEQQLGPEHPDTARSLTCLAELYRRQGRYVEAEPLCLRSLYIWEQQLGQAHPDAADTLNNLGLLYAEQGKYTDAESLYQRALHIYEQSGPEYPGMASAFNNLASLYFEQGKYTEAEPLYQRALAIREKLLGPEHRDTVDSLHNLASLYSEQGKYTEAEPLYQRALAIREKLLGPEHFDVTFLLEGLAIVYFEQGKYDEAEPLYQRVLAIREKLLGAEHPHVAYPLNNLAELYFEQGKYDEVEPLYHCAHVAEKTQPQGRGITGVM